MSLGQTEFSRLLTGTGAFRESATYCKTALTFHSSAPSNHSREILHSGAGLQVLEKGRYGGVWCR